MIEVHCVMCERLLTLREALSGNLCKECLEEVEEIEQDDEPDQWIPFDVRNGRDVTPGMLVFYQQNY